MEEYQAIARRILDEAFNKGNLDFVDEALSPDRVSFHVSGELEAPGGLKLIISLLRHIFPDIQVAIEDAIYEGDRAIMRWRATGTHTGELLGVAPTGRRATWTGISINRFVDGKIAEIWFYIDSTASR